MFEQALDYSEEPGPQAKGVNLLEIPLRQLHATQRAPVQSDEVMITCNCVRNPGGRAESRPRPSEILEEISRRNLSASIVSSDHWTGLEPLVNVNVNVNNLLVPSRSKFFTDRASRQTQEGIGCCAVTQGRTRARQEQAQAVAPGQKQNWAAGGASTSGQKTKQEGERTPRQAQLSHSD